MNTIQDSAANGDRVAIAAVTVWALIAIVKRPEVPIPLPPRARPFLALGLGQVYGVLEAVVGGMAWRSALLRGLVVACAAIAAHEIASKAKGPTDPPSVPPVVMSSLVLAMALLLTSCTPFERAQARTIGVPIARVIGAVCERVASTTGDPWVDFSCSIVRAAGDVLGNMDTRGDKPEGPAPEPVTFTVRVPAEQADAFEQAQR